MPVQSERPDVLSSTDNLPFLCPINVLPLYFLLDSFPLTLSLLLPSSHAVPPAIFHASMSSIRVCHGTQAVRIKWGHTVPLFHSLACFTPHQIFHMRPLCVKCQGLVGFVAGQYRKLIVACTVPGSSWVPGIAGAPFPGSDAQLVPRHDRLHIV